MGLGSSFALRYLAIGYFVLAGLLGAAQKSEGGVSWKLLPLRSSRQIENWGGGGAVIQALAWSRRDPLEVVLGTDRNGLWFSQDGGRSVKPAQGCPLPDIKAVCFAPWKDHEVWCLAGAQDRAPPGVARKEGLWSSSDGGATWRFVAPVPVEQGVYGALLVCESIRGKRFIAAASAGRGILLSQDGGKRWRWSSVGREGWVYGLTVWRGVIFAATSEGVFLSEDSGGTFRKIEALQDVRFVTAKGPLFAVGPRRLWLVRPEGPLVTTDGEQWKPAGGVLKPSKRYFAGIAADTQSPGTLYAVLRAGAGPGLPTPLVSYDGGRSWSIAERIEKRERFTGPEVFPPEAVVAHPASAGVALAGIDRELMRTTNTGKSWQPWGAGFYGWRSEAGGLWADQSDPARLYLCLGEAGLWVSPNQGRWFMRLKKPAGRCVSVASGPDPSRPVLVMWSVLAEKWTLHVSFDKGRTWREAAGTESLFVPRILFHPLHAETIAAGPFLSTDGGKHFSKLPAWVLSIDGDTWYGVGPKNPRRLLRSTDNGASWRPWGPLLPAVPLCVARLGDKVFAGTRDGLFVLEGRAWRKTVEEERLPPNTEVPAILPDPAVPGRVLAVFSYPYLRQGGILLSEDGGRTWLIERKPFPVTALARVQVGRYLAATDVGIYRLLLGRPAAPGHPRGDR